MLRIKNKMFNKIKENIIREVINELEELHDYYYLIAIEKKYLDEYNDFEVGIGVGIGKAKEKVYEILNKYK